MCGVCRDLCFVALFSFFLSVGFLLVSSSTPPSPTPKHSSVLFSSFFANIFFCVFSIAPMLCCVGSEEDSFLFSFLPFVFCFSCVFSIFFLLFFLSLLVVLCVSAFLFFVAWLVPWLVLFGVLLCVV